LGTGNVGAGVKTLDDNFNANIAGGSKNRIGWEQQCD